MKKLTIAFLLFVVCSCKKETITIDNSFFEVFGTHKVNDATYKVYPPYIGVISKEGGTVFISEKVINFEVTGIGYNTKKAVLLIENKSNGIDIYEDNRKIGEYSKSTKILSFSFDEYDTANRKYNVSIIAKKE